MSGNHEDVSSQPLVIVRRRRNVDEPHHGGVWKIAYADFMTAMMAFFLVMWLVNAADKKTIVQVAAYFNPMHLTDRFAAPPGVEDLTEADSKKPETESKKSEKKSKKGFEKDPPDDKQKLDADQESKENIGDAMDEAADKKSTAAGGKSAEQQKEQALFDNPGEMLEKLADEARASQPTTTSNPADGNISDPFDRTNRRAGKSQMTLKPANQPSPPPAKPASQVVVPAATQSQEGAKQKPPAQVAEHAEKPTPAVSSEDEKKQQKEALAKKVAADISSAISEISKEMPHVEVKATAEGLLISLLDDANFGMFEVGSAKPRPELVLAMDKVGDFLKGQKGKIVVRGHTDSRAYKSGVYDNWRLSAARAQMAYYMLVHGGVSEENFAAIEGRADRDPKNPSDTEAAENRRIDILIKEEKP